MITDQEITQLLVDLERLFTKGYVNTELDLTIKLINSYYFYKEKVTNLEQELVEKELDTEDYWL